jgi:hypothetical protein
MANFGIAWRMEYYAWSYMLQIYAILLCRKTCVVAKLSRIPDQQIHNCKQVEATMYSQRDGFVDKTTSSPFSEGEDI